ncbi:MAG TPA: hypothetical protein VG406_00585 [Isosphaeraceae bacterium]|jgi:hypothetical protein|nr:hypothetical protein [Isosphaeraceae bacterium]
MPDPTIRALATLRDFCTTRVYAVLTDDGNRTDLNVLLSEVKVIVAEERDLDTAAMLVRMQVLVHLGPLKSKPGALLELHVMLLETAIQFIDWKWIVRALRERYAGTEETGEPSSDLHGAGR